MMDIINNSEVNECASREQLGYMHRSMAISRGSLFGGGDSPAIQAAINELVDAGFDVTHDEAESKVKAVAAPKGEGQ